MISIFKRTKKSNSSPLQPLLILVKLISLAGLLFIAAENANAFEITEWQFQTSALTKHWDPSPEHVNHSKMFNLEFTTNNQWRYGFAWFDNSFGQPTQYLYAGFSARLFNTEWAYVKLTGGLLHGYKEEYARKIPLNGLGIAPALVPSVGIRYKRVVAELQFLGVAAGAITVGFRFGKHSR